jgi:hypothetical protein
MSVALSIRAASILFWLVAAGFGLPCVLAIRSLLAGGGIAYIFGFPAYGGGPFEQYGLYTTIPLVAGFLVVCILEGVAGWLLWGGHRTGAILGLLLLPVGAAYWWGFDLPIPPIIAAVRTAIVLFSWSTLS